MDADGLIRRQKFTTWGILGLALFVSVGMAEWSKRTAVGETVIDPAVMEEAVKIAAAREGISGLGGSYGGNGEGQSRKNLSDLGVSAVKSLATAEAQRRGGVFHSSGNDAATIQTSAGEQK